MDGIGGTVKDVVYQKVKWGLVTIQTPFELDHTVVKFVSAIICAYLT